MRNHTDDDLLKLAIDLWTLRQLGIAVIRTPDGSNIPDSDWLLERMTCGGNCLISLDPIQALNLYTNSRTAREQFQSHDVPSFFIIGPLCHSIRLTIRGLEKVQNHQTSLWVPVLESIHDAFVSIADSDDVQTVDAERVQFDRLEQVSQLILPTLDWEAQNLLEMCEEVVKDFESLRRGLRVTGQNHVLGFSGVGWWDTISFIPQGDAEIVSRLLLDCYQLCQYDARRNEQHYRVLIDRMWNQSRGLEAASVDWSDRWARTLRTILRDVSAASSDSDTQLGYSLEAASTLLRTYKTDYYPSYVRS